MSGPLVYQSRQQLLNFELADAAAVEAAVQELKAKGQDFIHEVRTEPWGQVTARIMSPEGVLVTLSYAPWLHEQDVYQLIQADAPSRCGLIQPLLVRQRNMARIRRCHLNQSC